MPLAEGAPVPNFSVLRGPTGDPVTGQELWADGPVAFHFYVFDFSGGGQGCDLQLCSFRDRLDRFDELGVRVFGVSSDSPFAHEAFASQLDLNYELLSDYDFEAARAFGLYYDRGADLDPLLSAYGAVNTRGSFLVDESGILRFAWHAPKVFDLPRPEPLIEAAETLLA